MGGQAELGLLAPEMRLCPWDRECVRSQSRWTVAKVVTAQGHLPQGLCQG